jgi:hypothetical protein
MLLRFGDEFFQPVMIVVGGKLKVVLAALHVSVVCIEQAPRLIIVGICFDEFYCLLTFGLRSLRFCLVPVNDLSSR